MPTAGDLGAASWDGIMPYWPAMLGDATGPEGQQPTGASVEAEIRRGPPR